MGNVFLSSAQHSLLKNTWNDHNRRIELFLVVHPNFSISISENHALVHATYDVLKKFPNIASNLMTSIKTSLTKQQTMQKGAKNCSIKTNREG